MEAVPNRAPRPNKSGTMAGSFRSRQIDTSQHIAYLTAQGLMGDKYISKANRNTNLGARSGEEEMLLQQENRDIESQEKRPGVYAKGKSKRQR